MRPLPDIDIAELEKAKKENFRQRLEWIDFYADWVRKTPNKVWSKQQKKLIG